MSTIYIKSVTAYGEGKTDAIISFNDRLNIVTGYSDTGKTCIARCIDYVFGSKTKPFDESTGYEGVRMQIETSNGSISFDRQIGRNQVVVESSIETIKSDIYMMSYSKNQRRPLLNDVWLKLIGINEEHKVPSNKNYEKKRLTWKTLRPLPFIDEDDIGRQESIIEPIQYVEKTLFLFSLLFLIYGHDFSDVDVQRNEEIKKVRRKAVEEYVNMKIKNTSDKQKEIVEMLEKYDGVDMDSKLEKIIEAVQVTEAQIAARVNSGRKLMASIMKYNTKLVECDILLGRYDALATQYKSDIKRLTFIVDGEEAKHNMPINEVCPFCEGKINVKKQQSYVKAANAELRKILLQLKGLAESVKDIKKQKEEFQNFVKEYQKEYDVIEMQLSKELKSKLADLSEKKEDYRKFIELKNEIKVYKTLAENLVADLNKLPDEDDNEDMIEYHPKEYFDDNFLEKMNIIAKEILEECCYENLLTARFNLQDFDIEVNGKKKGPNHGKGYRSYLNTIVSLMFRKYMRENAKYSIDFLIIDTPLLGLDQGVNDAAPESMRTALFKYFMNHQDEGQLIIIENWEYIPKLNYEESGANVIKFMKGKTQDRYGFLHDV